MEVAPSCWQSGKGSRHPIRGEVQRIQDHICSATGINLLGGLLASMGSTSPFEPNCVGNSSGLNISNIHPPPPSQFSG